jgi:hypothetical protein
VVVPRWRSPAPFSFEPEVVVPAAAVPMRSWRICATSDHPFLRAASAVWAADLDGESRSLFAFHCTGVSASTVAARPLVAFVATLI